MRNNIILKVFVFVFVIILAALKSFADSADLNVLSKIYVEKTDKNIYGINIFFNSKYNNSAFVQKKDTGSYYVFIPDTAMDKKSTSVIYKYGRDKSNIKINVEEKPFYKDDIKSSYIRLTVDVAPEYSIKILSNTMDKYSQVSSKPFFNTVNIIAILLLICGFLLILKVLKMANIKLITNSYTAFPAGYINYENNNSVTIPKNAGKLNLLSYFNMKKNIKSSENQDFSCFDIPITSDDNKSYADYKSVLSNTSKSMKTKAFNINQTNPVIAKPYADESSELELPIVDDIVQEKQEEPKQTQPELLSTLRLAPNKGFYLTTIEDNAFGLFGFVNDNIYLLKKFNDLSQINLQARFYDRNFDKDVYIVRMDSYKAMVEVSDSGMQELAVL